MKEDLAGDREAHSSSFLPSSSGQERATLPRQSHIN
jgi:hypothetical protein